MAELNISNIKNQINRIKNCVRDTYVALEDKDAILPATNNADSMANTIQNIPADSDRILKLRSNNGQNYDYLYYGYENNTFDLNELDFANVTSMEGFVKNANNIYTNSHFMYDFVRYNMPSYNKISNPSNQYISYFGINHLNMNLNAGYSSWAEDKGWLLDGEELLAISHMSFPNGSGYGWSYRFPVDLTATLKREIAARNSLVNIDFKYNIHPSLNIEGTSKIKDFSNIFNNCRNLHEIVNFDISNIRNGAYMFNNCSNLSNLNLIGNINNINNLINASYMFNNCSNLQNIPINNFYNMENMSFMFYNCRNLNIFPNLYGNYVTNIANMFYFSKLQNLNKIFFLNNSKINNSMYAFYYSTNLKNVLLNNLKVSNAYYMFSYCTNLTDVIINNCELSNASCLFYYDSKLTNITGNFYIKNVMNSMFYFCSNILNFNNVNFSFENNINVKGDSAFYGMSNLTTIPIVNIGGVFYNADSMYSFCNNLVYLPSLNLNTTESTLSIINMFANDLNLTEVDIPYIKDKTIFYQMFYNCQNLSYNAIQNILIGLPNYNSSYHNYPYIDYIGLFGQQIAQVVVNNSTLANDIINKGWILNINDLTVKFQGSYNTITDPIMKKCEWNTTSLSTAVYPSQVGITSIFTNIGNNNIKALKINKLEKTIIGIPNFCKNWTNLEYFEIEDDNRIKNQSISYLDNTFENCQSLTNLNFHNKLSHQYYLNNAFRNCKSLINLDFLSLPYSRIFVADNAFENCTNLITANLQDRGYGHIYNNMFKNCINLKNAIFTPSKGYQSIQAVSIFENCYNLTDVTIEKCNNLVVEKAFKNCHNLLNFSFPNVNILWGAGLKATFENARRITNIDNIIPAYGNNLVSIERMCADCWSLEHLPETLNLYKLVNAIETFINCTKLTTFSISNLPNLINASAMFSGCYNLTNLQNLYTPNLQRSNLMFINCKNLTAMPNMYVGNVINAAGMFKECINLTTVPTVDFKSATEMQNIFYNDTNLTEQSVWNIVNGLPNYNKIITPNKINDLTYLGFAEAREKLQNASYEITNAARAKGWNLYSNILSTFVYNFLDGSNRTIHFYGAIDKNKYLSNEYKNMLNMTPESMMTVSNINIGIVNGIGFDSQFFSQRFMYGYNLTSIDFKSLGSDFTNFYATFHKCYNLPSEELISITKAAMKKGISYINACQIFDYCTQLQNIPNNITGCYFNDSMYGAFKDCPNLTDIASLSNSQNVTSIVELCQNDIKLENIAPMVFGTKLKMTRDAFKNCPNLTNQSILNIVNSLPQANQLDTNKLTYLGLKNSQIDTIPEDVRQTLRNNGWNVPYPEGTIVGWNLPKNINIYSSMNSINPNDKVINRFGKICTIVPGNVNIQLNAASTGTQRLPCSHYVYTTGFSIQTAFKNTQTNEYTSGQYGDGTADAYLIACDSNISTLTLTYDNEPRPSHTININYINN